MFDRKLEELALQFDKFLSNPSDRHKNTGFHESIRSDIDHRMKQVEDRCEMINSKIDKGLLILQRDLQDFERANQSKLREMIENVVGPSLADLAESIKGQTLDIEEIRLQSQQLIKQVQGELIQKISELREPDSYSK
jgi:t-SNARE complex subunit (syntaxin)